MANLEPTSTRFSLNATDRSKILKDILFFALIPITFYIAQVLGDIQAPKHILSLGDFIPNNNTLIAVVSWVLNQALNTIRKYVN